MNTFFRIPDITETIFTRKLFWITLYAISMALLESAVVIYLRELYYPNGFTFPLQPTSEKVAITELLRELATLLMIISVAILSAQSKSQRFGWFLYIFAIWDIFYYVFLYALIGWPPTISEWDVLFLFPIMWVGPVWAPVVLSIIMIDLAFALLLFSNSPGNGLRFNEMTGLILGSMVIIIGFCRDIYIYMTQTNPDVPLGRLFYSKHTWGYMKDYTPTYFPWTYFVIGILLIYTCIGHYFYRNIKQLYPGK